MAERHHNSMSGVPMSGPTHTPDFDYLEFTQEWRKKAACLGTDPGMWFRDLGHVFGPRVREICGGCPVRKECRDWILDVPGKEDQAGWIAGMSVRQRAIARAERRGVKLARFQ